MVRSTPRRICFGPAYDPVPIYPVRLDGDDVLVDVKNPLNQQSL